MYEDEPWKASTSVPKSHQAGAPASTSGESGDADEDLHLLLSHLAFDSYVGFARRQGLESLIRRLVALVVGLATVWSLWLKRAPDFAVVIAEVLSVTALYFGAEAYLARSRASRLKREERELLMAVDRSTRRS